MRYKRVFIIYPYYPGHDADAPPVGLGYLAENLEANGVVYKVYNMNIQRGISVLKKNLARFDPDLIGITMMTYRYNSHYELIKTIRKHFPLIKIAAGGPHLSFFKEQVLHECPEIDYGFVMEAENSFKELCCGEALTKINGLLFRENEEVMSNSHYEFKADLDAFPFPKYTGFDLNKYTKRSINLLTSRGCPYNCIFCGHHLVTGKCFRFRDPVKVVDEIEYWVKKGYSDFNVTDSNFSVSKERVYAICDGIEKRGLKVRLCCGDGVRADRVDLALLKRMRQVGFRALSIGVESGSDRVLKNMEKGESLADIERTVKMACELGYDVTLFFVIGSPGETEDDVKRSIEFALRYPIFSVNFNLLIPYPGTKLYDWVKNHGYLLRDYREYLNDVTHVSNTPVYQTPELPLQKILALVPILKQAQRTVHRNTIRRKLAGKNELIRNAAAMLYTSDLFQRVKNSNRLFQMISSNITRRF